MYVKLKTDWFGMRAGTVQRIGRGVGEILVLRKFAVPADPPGDPEPKPKRKRKRHARPNNANERQAFLGVF